MTQSSGGISNPLIKCKIALTVATVPTSWLSLIEEYFLMQRYKNLFNYNALRA